MPLEVMLHTMRLHWREGRVDEAVALAKAAAPYLHARASASRGAVTLGDLRDEQLDELCGCSFGGAAPAEGDTQ
jgi:hypothetical protein